MRVLVVVAFLGLAACAGPSLPPPNSANANYDARNHAVQVFVSGLQPASSVALVSPQGARYPAAGLSLLSAPHVTYNPPPSVGIGIGGFGFGGCCFGIGSGLGLSVPVGSPTPAEVSDQYIASALIPVPADYAANWAGYRVEIFLGNRPTVLAAPPPAAG